jgi:hypothetical protein
VKRKYIILWILPWVLAAATHAADGDATVTLSEKRVSQMTTFTSPDRPLAERFAVPPSKSRILKIVHTLPDTP